MSNLDEQPLEVVGPITDAATLASWVEELASEPQLAVDTEGDGYHRYRARLCVIQIGVPGTILLIDSLAIEDLSCLAALFGPAGPEKILHDASYDTKMLAERGLHLGNVLDTAAAARLLNEPSTGLSALLGLYLDVKLDKGPQLADWGERPLPDAHLTYLAGDVLYLAPLAELLRERIIEADLLDELQVETDYLMSRAVLPEVIRAPWSRVKGAGDFKPRQQAMLAALANAREREASCRDVPPFRVAPNRALVEAVRRPPSDRGRLHRIRGLSQLPEDSFEHFSEARSRGTLLPEDELPIPNTPSSAERAQRKAREKALSLWREKEAKARGVGLQAILPGHCLRRIAGLRELDTDILGALDGLGSRRIERYGEALLKQIQEADQKVL